MPWPNAGTNSGKFLENIYTKKLLLRNKIMGQYNFRKCSMFHPFSEMFQCVINRRRNANSYFSPQAIVKAILRMENIGQIYHKHKKL